jgi:hypothetical protein
MLRLNRPQDAYAHRQLPLAEMSQEREWLADSASAVVSRYSSRASLDLLGCMLSTKGVWRLSSRTGLQPRPHAG